LVALVHVRRVTAGKTAPCIKEKTAVEGAENRLLVDSWIAKFINIAVGVNGFFVGVRITAATARVAFDLRAAALSARILVRAIAAIATFTGIRFERNCRKPNNESNAQ